MAKTSGIDAQILAEQYGFSAAVLNSNHELKSLFQQAVKNNWDQQKFTARLYNTKWYKHHSDTYRNAIVQKSVDPKTYAQRVSQQHQRIIQAGAAMGVRMSPKTQERLAEMSYQLGWDDNQLKAHLANYITFTKGDAFGQAGQYLNQLRQYAGQMGVTISNKTLDNWTRSATAGHIDINDALNRIKETAISKYPALAGRLREGETIDTIADPYKQEMAQLLEIDPESISNQDHYIQNAFTHRESDGKHSLQTLNDFADALRYDSRWKSTQNAQDAVSQQIHQLGQMFGKIGN